MFHHSDEKLWAIYYALECFYNYLVWLKSCSVAMQLKQLSDGPFVSLPQQRFVISVPAPKGDDARRNKQKMF